MIVKNRTVRLTDCGNVWSLEGSLYFILFYFIFHFLNDYSLFIYLFCLAHLVVVMRCGQDNGILLIFCGLATT